MAKVFGHGSQKITIEMLPEDPEINIAVMRVEYDKDEQKVVSTRRNASEVYSQASEVMQMMMQVEDPVTKQTVTMSGAGLQLAITSMAFQLLKKKWPELEYDAKSNRMLFPEGWMP